MRFILVICIWILILGGLSAYSYHRDQSRPQQSAVAVETAAATGTYDLFITPTFGVEADPFALDADTAMENAFLVQLNGHKIPLEIETVQRGVQVSLLELSNLNQGINEIYIKASPPVAKAHLEHGVRVVLSHENKPIVDQTLWSSSGGIVSGTVTFELETAESVHDH